MARLSKVPRGGWQLREVLSDGTEDNQYISAEHTEEQAKAMQLAAKSREKERKVGLRLDVGKKKAGITFEQFAKKEYLPGYEKTYPRSTGKKKNHLKHLYKVFAEIRLGDNEEIWLDAWRKYRALRLDQEKIKGQTLEDEWMALRRVLNVAVTLNKIPFNPLGKLKWADDLEIIGAVSDKEDVEIFTKDELEAIYEVAGDFWGAQWRIIAQTGLRRGEIIQQPKSLVTPKELIVKHAPRKGLEVKDNETRKIPLNDIGRECREKILFYNKRQSLFFSKQGDSDWSKRFTADRNAAGISYGTLNSLRHTFISYLVNEKRHPLPVVADLAGHACITTTKNYLHQTEDQARKAIEDLDL